jgi:hypothetical protein
MTSPKKPVTRRDATGHLDPEYQRKLLEESGKNRDSEGKAFLDKNHSSDALAEELGETFVAAATSGEDAETDFHDQVLAEEDGGPFVTTSAREEFAQGTDESNIAEATREPLPRTSKAEV